MTSLIADATLAFPWLAVALPLGSGMLAIVALLRARARSGVDVRAPFVATALIWGLTAVVALVVIGLGHMFAPSRADATVYAAEAAGVGAVVALSGLAGYALLQRRGDAAPGFGFIFGPILLITVPLALAPVLREVAQGAINDDFMDDMRRRGDVVSVVADEVETTVVGGSIEAVRMRISVTSTEDLWLVRSDSDIDYGLLNFRLEPLSGERDAWLYAESPIGVPKAMRANVPVSYLVTFGTVADVPRPVGAWELVVAFTNDGEAYEHVLLIPDLGVQ